MVNRKHINHLLRFLPGGSKLIGYPRKQLSMEAYAAKFEKVFFQKLEVHGPAGSALVPSIFVNKGFNKNYQRFIALLKKGRVWGRNGAVISSDDYFITDVSREFNNGHVFAHSVFYTIRQQKVEKIKGKVAVIGTSGDNIYYHWMLDILPRLGIISEKMDLNEIDFFVTGFTGLNFQRESLEAAGINSKKVLASNENWMFHIEAEELWVPSLPGILDRPNIYQIKYLRHLFGNFLNTELPSRKIYISRANTKRRFITNEEELKPFLLEKGFEIICCEDFSIAEQVKIFSEAAIIVGSHGSAFTNLVFCNKGIQVMEIFNHSHINACFWHISVLLQLDYAFLQGNSVAIDANNKNDNTYIEKNVFFEAVSKMQTKHFL